jgi:Na+/melibiose symporter-like transporter
MSKKQKMSQSQGDGVEYRRAKTWRIALSQMNSGASMTFYILMTYASYVANAGYGIATAVVGLILTSTRILDGFTDPLIALLIDKLNTRFGKIRIFMVGGWLLETLAIFLMFVWGSGKGFGIPMFVAFYIIYIIGYTMNNVVHQIIGPVMVNDPRQRPLVSVWSTVYNYLVPMIVSMIITVGILPRFGNQYTVEMLALSSTVSVSISFVLLLFACVGVSEEDKPENFRGINVAEKTNQVSIRDMWKLLRNNRALQTYIVSAASDKLAQQTGSQAIVATLLYGIIIGNIQLASIIGLIAMLPSIIFAILGAIYAGKYGNKESIVRWSIVSIGLAVVSIVFFLLVDTRSITVAIIPTIIFFLLTLLLNGSKMCITTATSAHCADIIDYELDRSGKFLPAAVTATYSFIDKLISSLGASIAAGAVALIGYTTTMPQPTAALSTPVFVMGMLLFYGLPILGWVLTVMAMKFNPLSKLKMIEIQKSIHDKKQAALAEHPANDLTAVVPEN